MITNTEEQKVEKAQKAFEQARAKYENAKKKQSEIQRKRETHYKCMMGGIVKKYFPECMSYEEHELNEILSAALATNECKSVIARITREAGQVTQSQKASPAPEKPSRPVMQKETTASGSQEQNRMNQRGFYSKAKDESEAE